MREYVGLGLILKRETVGEADGLVTVFTEKYGKLTARAQSLGKITSKLSAHLEPGIISWLRIVEQRGMRLTDALKSGQTALKHSDLFHLSLLLPDSQPESEIWELVTGGNFGWNKTLEKMGWDSSLARCVSCGKSNPKIFHLPGQEYYCDECGESFRLAKDDVIFIHP